MAAPSWEDVKKVVDDPSVPHDQKKALLEAYYVADAEGNVLGGTHNDELEEYLDDYDISWGDGFGQSFSNSMPWSDSSEDRLDNAYGEAKKSYDAAAKKDDEHNRQKKAGQDLLAASEQRASDGGAGVGNSNFLLDAGAPGLRYFANFLPVYEKAKSVIGVGTTVDTSVDNMYKRYDEQRDIDFHKIDVDIVELRQVATDTRNRQADAETSMGKVWANWTGSAADGSRAFVADFSKKAGAHADAIDHVAEVMRATCHTVSGLVNAKARTILERVVNVYDIAGLSPEQIGQVVQGATSEDESLLRRVAGFVNFRIDDEACDGDVWKEEVRKKSREWLQGTFHNDVNSKWELFEKICNTTRDSVNQAWEELGKQLDALNTKPFDQAKAEPPAEKNTKQSDGDSESSGDDSSSGNNQPAGTPGGPPGGPPGGTPGGPPGGPSGGTPEVPKVENPLDKNGDGKPDLPEGLDKDGDGKPDAGADLEGKPDGGKPDGVKSEEEPETVTIKSGDNEIKVTEPDAEGQVLITVDTPTSEPKTYQVDFSANPDAAQALLGQNGAAALAGALGGATPVSAATPGVPGTQVTAGGGAGPTGDVIPVQADADGKALIELDGLAITAEVDPLTGEINLSVDNGDGTPEQYGVEFGEDDAATPGLPGAEPAADLGQSDRATGEPLVGTLPADGPPAFATTAAEAEPASTGAQGFTEPVSTPPAAAGPSSGQGFDQGFDQPQPSFAQPAAFDQGFGQPVVPSDPSGTTSASGASMVGGSGGGFDGADSLSGGGNSGSDSPWSSPRAAADQGLADTSAAQAGQPGSAALPSIQDGAPHGQPGGSPAGAGMMGGGMMGGGMAGGGQQQGGGDTERSSSSGQWRTTGSLFDDDDVSLQRLSGLLGEDRR